MMISEHYKSSGYVV